MTGKKVLQLRIQSGDDEARTREFWIASKIASNMGLTSATGGVTPHIRTRRLLARTARLLLSLTREGVHLQTI